MSDPGDCMSLLAFADHPRVLDAVTEYALEPDALADHALAGDRIVAEDSCYSFVVGYLTNSHRFHLLVARARLCFPDDRNSRNYPSPN
jgi:hypothetical protein